MIQNLLRKALVVSMLVLPMVSLTARNASAQDLQFTLKNQSGGTLTEFYVEVSSDSTWGENLLTTTIESGESGTVTIADGQTACTYDILGVFSDGTKAEDYGLDLCKLGSYTYK